VRIDDAAYAAVAAFYSHRQVIELLYTIGSYMMLARIMEVAEDRARCRPRRGDRQAR